MVAAHVAVDVVFAVLLSGLDSGFSEVYADEVTGSNPHHHDMGTHWLLLPTCSSNMGFCLLLVTWT